MDGPSDINALAEALRVDGVVIDRVMGSGEAQESEDRIAALIRSTPFPVYVALVRQPPDMPAGGSAGDDVEALTRLLSRRLGDGLYVVKTTDSIDGVSAYGLDTDHYSVTSISWANAKLIEETLEAEVGSDPEDYVRVPPVVEAEGQVRAAEAMVERSRDDDSDGSKPALSEQDARDLALRAIELEASETWRPNTRRFVDVQVASRGLSVVVGAVSAMVIALLLGQTLVGWPRWGKKGPGASTSSKGEPVGELADNVPDLEEEREKAQRSADALAERLSATDWESMRDQDVAARALTARSALEPLLASGEVADVVGAQVVARAGLHDLKRAERGTGAPLRFCFFDPRHGAAATTVGWRLGDGKVDVPCCAECGASVGAGERPRYLELTSRTRVIPYWEREDVWARTGFGSLSDDIAADVLADRGER